MIKIKLTEDIIHKGQSLKAGSILRSKNDKALKEYVENKQALVILGKLKTTKKTKDDGNN